jgi:Holliday junction resolvase RusA-like endonuclease
VQNLKTMIAKTIYIKPLSVNGAWQGKRFKTPAYKKYERDLLLLLPQMTMPKAPYEINIEVAFSSKASDLDNILKPFLDVLQKKYAINDKDIYRLSVEKTIVPKGQEFIKFSIRNIEPIVYPF